MRHRGVAVLDPVATWITLARELEVADLTAVTDRLISGTLLTPPLSSRRALEVALGHFGGRGTPRLRKALTMAREGAWSRPETLLRLLIVDAGLPEPVPNFETPLGRGTATVDLAWPRLMLGVEYQGRWHDETPSQRSRDARRREALIDAGWAIVEVRATDLFGTPHALVARLVHRLVNAGWVTAPLNVTNLPCYEP